MSVLSVCSPQPDQADGLCGRTDITAITCRHHKIEAPMRNYIAQLCKVSEEILPKPKHKGSENRADWEPIETQIRRWWINLPPIMQQRRFQIVEIAAQCKGRFHKKPALREVATTLRALGWVETRDWSSQGRNKRFWQPKI